MTGRRLEKDATIHTTSFRMEPYFLQVGQTILKDILDRSASVASSEGIEQKSQPS